MLNPEVQAYFTDIFAANDARRQLIKSMPRTVEVVSEASDRFFRGLGDYALTGAAVERSIILRSLDLSSAI